MNPKGEGRWMNNSRKASEIQANDDLTKKEVQGNDDEFRVEDSSKKKDISSGSEKVPEWLDRCEKGKITQREDASKIPGPMNDINIANSIYENAHNYAIMDEINDEDSMFIDRCIQILEAHGIPFCRKYCHCSLPKLLKNEIILTDAKLYLLELKSKMSSVSGLNFEEFDYDFMEVFLLKLLDADNWYADLHLQCTERIENLNTRIFALEVEMMPFMGKDDFPENSSRISI